MVISIKFSWKSKKLSEESIKIAVTANNSFAPKLTFIQNVKIAVKFEGYCLKQEKISFTLGNVVSIFLIYELNIWLLEVNTDFLQGDYLFGAVKLTKNYDHDKYSYSTYGIGFDARLSFSLPNSEFGYYVIIFRIDNSSLLHTDDNSNNDNNDKNSY